MISAIPGDLLKNKDGVCAGSEKVHFGLLRVRSTVPGRRVATILCVTGTCSLLVLHPTETEERHAQHASVACAGEVGVPVCGVYQVATMAVHHPSPE
jgi:hypothetical protein